jgi:putative salt-induced outer membrane protein YdiY
MRQILAAVLVAGLAPVAFADTVSLNNGDKITGTILEVTSASVVVQTPYAGKLTIELPAVKTMQSEKAVSVADAAGAKQQQFVSPTPDGKTWQKTAAYVPPPPPAPARFTNYLDLGPGWKNQLSIGASNTAGNDETTTFAGALNFHYTKKPDEITLKFEGAYGMSNGAQNAGLFSQTAVWRHDLADRLFGYVGDDVRYDAIKGISLQGTATVGLGYKLVDEDKLKIDVRGGPGITYQRTFDGTTNTSAAAEAGFRLQYIFNERTSLTHEDTYITSLDDFKMWRIHSETALNFKLDLESGLGLKFGFNDDYENEPAAGRKNNDTRLMLSLTLDF